ncbi:ComEC/Rec2 family competence protein [Kitasatospora sp. NPDC007106]|uniref:ComEC/Rec2 family competence protein n=1 Tax=Kitasatospora sp. NPDC007106 TaxID=3156914 RepID=UPI00340247BE
MTSAVLSVDPVHHPPLVVTAVVATGAALFLLRQRAADGTRRIAPSTAAVLLSAAAATLTTVLHTADLHRGPIPDLVRPSLTVQATAPSTPPTEARAGVPSGGTATPAGPAVPGTAVASGDAPGTAAASDTAPDTGAGAAPGTAASPKAAATAAVTAVGPGPPTIPGSPESSAHTAEAKGTSPVELSVDLTVAGDPTPRTGRVHGTTPGQAVLTFDAVVDRVRFPMDPGRSAVAVHTPVTVLVRAQDIAAWRGLVPSTRVAAGVRATAPGERDHDSAARLVALGPPRLLAPPGRSQQLAAELRAGLREATDHLSPDIRGLLPGLVVGDTSRLPDDLREVFRATDLGHLTAVSGGNLAILLTVLLGASRKEDMGSRGGLAGLLGLSIRTTALVGTGLTLAFVTVCRPEPSVLRAAATGLLGLLALATGRPRQGVPALAGAVLLLVLLDPYLARSYGFLLSTLATAGLLTLGPRWTEALCRRGWPTVLATATGATAAAQALCAPVTILLAPRVSLVAVPCNLLAEAAVAPATLLGFAALAAEPFAPGAARVLADLAAVPTGWLAAVARQGAAVPGALLDWPDGLTGALLLAVTTVALCWGVPPLLSARRAASRRVRTALAAGVVLALAAVLLRPPAVTRIATGWPPAGWRLAMCDVGQGDMAVLPLASDTAVVVDTGPDPAAADNCLRDLGISRIPLLILTHFHADHVEGVPGVLHGRTVAALQVTLLGTPPGEQARVLGWASAAGIPLLQARRGEHRAAGPDLAWDVLWPDDSLGPSTPGANNASVALLATVGPPGDQLRLALLGDLEPPAQAALMQRGPPDRVDVLKVAHHGSANQDWDLTGALHPTLALISCGHDNPYGHPAPRTVDRLSALGATVLRTDRAGDIAVLGGHRHLRMATHPHHHRS